MIRRIVHLMAHCIQKSFEGDAGDCKVKYCCGEINPVQTLWIMPHICSGFRVMNVEKGCKLQSAHWCVCPILTYSKIITKRKWFFVNVCRSKTQFCCDRISLMCLGIMVKNRTLQWNKWTVNFDMTSCLSYMM